MRSWVERFTFNIDSIVDDATIGPRPSLNSFRTQGDSMVSRLISVFFFLLGLSGCSLDASITNTGSVAGILPSIQERKEPDFISGEIVTTSNGTPGYQVKAVFGEVIEKQTTTTGWKIDGVFYE